MNVLPAERLLARTFFAQFFESEIMPPGLPQIQLVIWGIALLAAPGYVMAFAFAINYGATPQARLLDATLLHELFFVTFAMIGLGFVALFIWEGVFPDRRDVRVLGTLPLRIRTHVIARLAALGAVAVLFTTGVNLPPAIVYGLILWGNDLAAGPFRAVAAHMIATSMGGLFLFFLLIAAQGVLLNVLGRRMAERVALLLQAIFVVVVLETLLFVPRLGMIVRSAFRGDDQSIAAFLPPAWFLALYDVVSGTSRSVPTMYALGAVGATVLAVIAATALLAGSHRRLVRMALETPGGGREARLGLAAIGRAVAGVAARDPVTRGVAAFTIRTIMRSRTHLMMLATYLGVAVALVLPPLLSSISISGRRAFSTPTVAVFSIPLLFNFFTLCGMRVLLAVPTEVKANWAVRFHAFDDRMVAMVRGVRLALLLSVVAPIALLAGAFALALWGVRVAALHAIFTGALGLLLVDILLIGFRKIPFTCTYYPGRSRARTLFPLYAMAFSLYTYTLAAVEIALLDRPVAFVVVLAVIATVIAGLDYLRSRTLHPPPGLRFEEQDPDLVFQGFGLSEGLAAGRPPAVAAPRIVHSGQR